ncbi:protease complex subunit PrcB family protein [Flavobacterium eburneipallidum]|uniref:protease complex subunit PrcB family protein n=1 Tax=Flavobacterium eburneipallidum TaxID=3003263 RepID=UPI0022ABE5CB|nr:protease complex subunit PrcB family protein [Flavobacterium eburneipallidum]
MKKVLLASLTLVLVSCSSSLKPIGKKHLYEILTQQSDGGANIRFFEILSEPKEIVMLQNDEKLKNKIQSSDVQNANFVVLNMGEKPTGGYQISVETVVETDKNIIITVKETTPDANGMVIQALTTPYCIVKVNSKKEIIIK